MQACFSGHHECALALIDVGAAVDTVGKYGSTALMFACASGHHECAQALLNAGAAVDRVDNVGETALMRVCFSGHHECAQALLNAGAAVDRVINGGETALMFACYWGHHECTQTLIDAQANLELTNRDGKNALMTACESPPTHLSLSQRHGRIRCALALLEATAPIQETDIPNRAASLKLAGERLQQIEVVLASTHVIEDAPPLASVNALKSDAQGIFVTFAGEMLARAPPRRRSRRLAAKC